MVINMPTTSHDLTLELAKERVAFSIVKKELENKVNELILSQATANRL
jgi:hypothetical protein